MKQKLTDFMSEMNGVVPGAPATAPGAPAESGTVELDQAIIAARREGNPDLAGLLRQKRNLVSNIARVQSKIERIQANVSAIDDQINALSQQQAAQAAPAEPEQVAQAPAQAPQQAVQQGTSYYQQ